MLYCPAPPEADAVKTTVPVGDPASTVVFEAETDTVGSELTITEAVAVELDTPWLSVTTSEIVVVPVEVDVQVGSAAVEEEKEPVAAEQEYELPPEPPETADVSSTV